MKLVFKENPKFGDEQDVTQQIIAIDENIEKLFAEIKRFEVGDRSPIPSLNLRLPLSVLHRGDRTSACTDLVRIRINNPSANELRFRSVHQ